MPPKEQRVYADSLLADPHPSTRTEAGSQESNYHLLRARSIV